MSYHSTVDSKSRKLAQEQNEKGLKYLAKGRVDKAEVHFQKALQLNPNSASAHNNLGNLLLGRHELYLAAWEFERAAALAPTDVIPLVNLGLVYDEAGRLDDAVRYYQEALELDPNNAIAFGNLLRIYVKQEGDPEEIHTMLRQLIFIDSRPDWVAWAEDLLATRYALFHDSVMSSNSSMNSTKKVQENGSEILPRPPAVESEHSSANPPAVQGPVLMEEPQSHYQITDPNMPVQFVPPLPLR